MPNCTQKTMLLLRALSDCRGTPATLERLSEVTGINKSTAAHILKTLCGDGYVHRVSHTLGYLPGPELHMLTRYGRYGEDIIAECHPILEHLRAKCGGTAVLAVMKEGRKYIIDRAADASVYKDSDANILGDDIYRTVTGRVLLAAMPPDEALRLYSTLGAPKKGEWDEVRSRKDFIACLAAIGKMPCYSVESVNGSRGWLSFAVPIYRSSRCVGALGLAISFSGEKGVPCGVDREEICAELIKCRGLLEKGKGLD